MDKVRILGVDYDVLVEDVVLLEGQACYGCIEHNDAVIRLQRSNTPQKQTETIIHEILHGIINAFDPVEQLGMSNEVEERVVRTLGRGLYQVIKDNGTELLQGQTLGR